MNFYLQEKPSNTNFHLYGYIIYLLPSYLFIYVSVFLFIIILCIALRYVWKNQHTQSSSADSNYLNRSSTDTGKFRNIIITKYAKLKIKN